MREYYSFYFREVLKRVKKSVGLDRKTLIPALGSIAVGLLIYYWFRDVAQFIDQIWEAIAFTFAPLILLTIAFFVYHLLNTPAVIFNAHRREINKQKAVINSEVNLMMLPEVGEAIKNTEWVFLRVVNRSGIRELTDCSCTLLAAQGQRGLVDFSRRLPAQLAWGSGFISENGKLDIPRDGEVILDIAHADLSYKNGRFDLERNREWLHFPPDEYSVLIRFDGRVEGNPIKPIHRSLTVVLERGDSLRIEGIRAPED